LCYFEKYLITMNGLHKICNLSLIYYDYLKHKLIGFSCNLIPAWRVWCTFGKVWCWCYA